MKHFKVGQIVRIRNDLDCCYDGIPFGVSREMTHYRDKLLVVGEIVGKREARCCIVEHLHLKQFDGSFVGYNWNEYMFSHIQLANTNKMVENLDKDKYKDY